MLSIIKKYENILDENQKKKIGGLIFLMVIGAGLEAFSVSLIIPYITSVLSSRPGVMITLLLIGAFALKNIYLYFLKCVQNYFIVKNSYYASVKLFRTYLNKSYDYFLYNNSNNIVTVINVYVAKSFFLIDEFLNLITEVIIDFFLIGILLFLNYKITLVIFIVMGILLFFFKICISPTLLNVGKKSNDAYIGRVACVSQAVNGIKEIKMFACENYFISQYKKFGSENVELHNKKNKYFYMPKYIIEFIAVSAMLIFILLSSSFFQYDTKKIISEAAVFSFVLFRMLPSVIKINSYLNQIAYYMPSLLKIDEEISSYLKNNEQTVCCQVNKMKMQHTIQVCDVTFSYNHTAKNIILKNINLKIKKGECIGIIGASGIGKTTLIDIILGYLKPDKGMVLVDNTDINNNLEGWRKNIGYVPQMIFLSDDTIKNNIAFGKKLCREAYIWKLLKRVRLADFVSSLPEGINTQIGERGIRLSGGQRQRIGIARALYHDPDILVLDEATASLDNELEKEIMEDLYGFSGEKTMIIIAHRLSSLDKCEKIYRIENSNLLICHIKS